MFTVLSNTFKPAFVLLRKEQDLNVILREFQTSTAAPCFGPQASKLIRVKWIFVATMMGTGKNCEPIVTPASGPLQYMAVFLPFSLSIKRLTFSAGCEIFSCFSIM